MRLNQYEWDPEKDIIAEGAFAEVFKAKDTNSTNRYVALKIYKEAVSKGTSVSSGNKKYSLEKEFQNVDGLSHSNIITYFGLDYIKHKDAMGRSSSYAVLIMEYAKEGTLSDLLQTNSENKFIDKIIRDILYGVRYLHSEGIIHRDLKPGNILIVKNRKGSPVAKITDFGISRDTFSEDTIQQSMTEGVGTPHYMAPEQIYKKKFGFNGEITNRTDIWAIGVIVYRALTGKLPFGHNNNDFDLVREAIINDSPDYSGIPPIYVKFLKACFYKEASKRPENIDGLLQLLEGIDSEKTVYYTKTTLANEEKTIQQANFNKDSKDVFIEKATRGRRVLAWTIDFIIAWLLLWFNSGIYYILTNASIEKGGAVLIAFLVTLNWALYFIVPELKYGKTLGAHITGLRLININKRKIEKNQIIIRNMIKGVTIFGFIPLLTVFAFGGNQSISHILSTSYFLLLCFFTTVVSIIFNRTIHNHFAKLMMIRNPKGNLLSGNYKIKIKPEGKNERIIKQSIVGLLLLGTLFLMRRTYYENYRFNDIDTAGNESKLRVAKLGDKYGFVTNDFRYKTVVPFKYDYAWTFSKGLARVKLGNK